MHLKAVLFDLDGTLVDSAPDIARALRRTLKALNKEHLVPDDVRPFIGGGARRLLEAVLKDAFTEEAVSLFRSFYAAEPARYSRPYDGIPELLNELKRRGLKLAVVTNKPDEITHALLKSLNLLDYFEFVAGGDTFPEKKPSPLPVLKTLERLSVEPKEALLVGDTEADVAAALSAGCYAALALWGYGAGSSLKPHFTLKSPSELLELLGHPQLGAP
ncbi:MAG: phosphoglycolate phosphatase [Aquificae bacterium]|nr:phosphoglycolate phosphatase [Aquificota bacterium]